MNEQQEKAMESRRITVLSAGLGVPSSSRLLADQLAASAERELAAAGFSVQVDVVELRDLAVDIANNFVTGYAAPRLADVIAGVEASDGIIAVTPVFSASYSGLFKSFIDVLDPKSLDGKAVLLGATGGTDRHQMVLDYAMRPLFSYLRTRITATGVFAGPQDWGTTDDGGASTARPANLPACWRDRSRGGSLRPWSPCPSNSSWRASPACAEPAPPNFRAVPDVVWA
jgi:FMN reductase